ncbi:MAG: FHA domain-containing protein [Tepidisphaeraceae bacterium]|jgi:pSer/pThr/pTyr-binding forkhead associated (FHA) protein
MQVVLFIFQSKAERQSVSISGDITVIGRREDCDLRISHLDVSRRHCRLLKEPDGLRVEDMGSSNGTLVNGKKVSEALMSPGDRLRVGPVTFVVQIDGQPLEDEIVDPTASPIVESSLPALYDPADDFAVQDEKAALSDEDGLLDLHLDDSSLGQLPDDSQQ